MLQCKTVIKGIFFKLFITQSTAESTKGNRLDVCYTDNLTIGQIVLNFYVAEIRL